MRTQAILKDLKLLKAHHEAALEITNRIILSLEVMEATSSTKSKDKLSAEMKAKLLVNGRKPKRSKISQ